MRLFSESRLAVWSYVGVGVALMTPAAFEGTNPLLVVLFGVGALLALVPAIYAFTKRNQTMPSDKKPDGIHISSVNQSGGFTGIQNVHHHGKPQRRFADADLIQIASHLQPGSAVDVQFMQGDGDGAQLATQIGDYLTSKGFKPEVGALLTNAHVKGVTLYLKNEPPCIQIGYPD